MRYLLALSLVSLLSCSAYKKQQASAQAKTAAAISLAGTSWVLESIPDFTLEQTRKPVTLLFGTDNHISGNGGCNRYGGDYTQSGDSLSIGHLLSTKMACTPGMETESHLMYALQEANRATVTGGKLELRKDSTLLASFTPGPKD